MRLDLIGAIGCASKIRTPSRSMTSERCGLSREKLLASSKNPFLAPRKIEQAEFRADPVADVDFYHGDACKELDPHHPDTETLVKFKAARETRRLHRHARCLGQDELIALASISSPD